MSLAVVAQDAEEERIPLIRVYECLLEHGVVTTEFVARTAGIHKRNALTYLNRLHAAGRIQPVGAGRARRWVMPEDLREHRLGVLDKISLHFGRQLAGFLSGTALHNGLLRVSPDEHPSHGRHERLDKKFRLKAEPHRPFAEFDDVIAVVVDALVRERVLTFRYLPRGKEPGARTVEPLTLVMYRRALYLMARSIEGERVSHYALDRMEDVALAGRFFYPENWSPDHALAGTFGIHGGGVEVSKVVLRFAPDVGDLVRRKLWHPGQVITEDGPHTILTFTAGGEEIVRFILEWGPKCEVLEPASLRTRVFEQLRAAVQLYGGQVGEGGAVNESVPLRVAREETCR